MDAITLALQDLVQALNSLAIGGVATAFLALAGIGGVAMAAVQTLKELTPLRRSFQSRHVQGWLARRWCCIISIEAKPPCSSAERAQTVEDPVDDGPTSPSVEGPLSAESIALPTKLLQDWVELAVGGNEFALFSPPAEQMAGYMKQAVPVMLDEARRYDRLVAVLAVGVSEEDFRMVLAGPSPETRSDYFDARARVTRRIERSIEGLEVDISTRWKFWMQLSSLFATAAVVEASVIAYPDASTLTYVIAIPMGLLGGYFAPIMRDLVAALQKLRQG